MNISLRKDLKIEDLLTKDQMERLKEAEKNDMKQKATKVVIAGAIVTTIATSFDTKKVSQPVTEPVVTEQAAVTQPTKIIETTKVAEQPKVMKQASVLAPVAVKYEAVQKGSALTIQTDGAEKKVFAPVEGKIVEKQKDAIVIENKDIKMKIDNVAAYRVEQGQEVTLGQEIGANTKEQLVLTPLNEEVAEVKVSEQSSAFNYKEKMYEAKTPVGIDATKDVAVIEKEIAKAPEAVVASNVLKGMNISNKNEAALLHSSNLFYSNERVSLNALTNENMQANVSEGIRDLEPAFVKALSTHGLGKYSEFALAIAQKESGGNPKVLAGDVMQSSQSKNGKVGSISNPEESIAQGVTMLANLLMYAEKYEGKVDARFVIQSYNYGARLLRESIAEDMPYSVAYHVDKTPEYRSSELARGAELTGGDVSWLENSYGDHTYTSKVMAMMDFNENATLTFKTEYMGIVEINEIQQDATIVGQTEEVKNESKTNVTVSPDKSILDFTFEEVQKTSNVELEKHYRALNNETLNRLLTGIYKNKFLDDVFLELDQILSMDEKLQKAKETSRMNYDLTGKKIYVDAGHGNLTANGKIAPGAISKNGLSELAQAHKEAVVLKSVLEKAGAEVIVSRKATGNGDTYAARIAEAKRMGADLIVTMHQNASKNKKTRGVLTIFEYDNAESKKLAKTTQNSIANALQGIIENKGLLNGDDSNKFNNHLGMFAGDFPVILTENGFMSNPADVALMMNPTYVEIFATSIANGIGEYFQSPAMPVEEETIVETTVEEEVTPSTEEETAPTNEETTPPTEEVIVEQVEEKTEEKTEEILEENSEENVEESTDEIEKEVQEETSSEEASTEKPQTLFEKVLETVGY